MIALARPKILISRRAGPGHRYVPGQRVGQVPAGQDHDQRAQEQDEDRRHPDRHAAAQRRRLPVPLVAAGLVNQAPPRGEPERSARRAARSARTPSPPGRGPSRSRSRECPSSRVQIQDSGGRIPEDESRREAGEFDGPDAPLYRSGQGYHRPTVTHATNSASDRQRGPAAMTIHSTGRSGGQSPLGRRGRPAGRTARRSRRASAGRAGRTAAGAGGTSGS